MDTTPRSEVEDRLGDDWTADQVRLIASAFLEWERRHPAAEPAYREAMLAAIARRVGGTLDLAQVAIADRHARQAAVAARYALRAAVVAAVGGGLSQVQAARQAGLTAATVQQWLRKERA